MTVTPLPTTVTPGLPGHVAHHNDIHTRLNAMAAIEVHDLVVANIVEAADATKWVSIDDFDISTGATGQRWVISYNIIYEASSTAGILIRFKNGALIKALTTADWTVTGEWVGPTATAPTIAGDNFSHFGAVRYRAGVASNSRAFGGAGTGVDVPLRGEFRVEINGSLLTNRLIGLEFQQNALDATVSTKIFPGSYAVASRVA